MDFIKLTLIEIKNTLKSKFLLILGILILLMSIAMPVVSAVSGDATQTVGFLSSSIDAKSYYGGDMNQESITVDGVTIEPDNPFYWNIKQFEDEKSYIDVANFQHPEAYDLVMEMGQMDYDYYVRFAKVVKTYEDYRAQMAWYGSEKLYDIYIYEHNTVDVDILKEALGWRRGIDDTTFETKYINITDAQRQAAIEEAQSFLDKIYQVVDNGDFAMFVDISIEQQNKAIEDNNKQIETFKDSMADLETQKAKAEQEYNDMVGQNADNELLAQQTSKIENLQNQIDSMQTNIDQTNQSSQIINEVTIPMLQYRLANNIIPGDGTWQDAAINSKQDNKSQLMYTKIVTEKQFNSNEYQYLKQQYKTYPAYVTATQKQIDKCNTNVIIAEQSLEQGKPDMSFVPKGARSQTYNFLYYSMFVALLAVVIGGWLIASEFQFGTIRLLIIRPKTRIKILMSKFTAGLAISLAVYIAGFLINMILNGILFSFADYANPNFSVGGQVGFFGYFLPKFLACIIPILFGYCVAFMLSTVVKNIAVAISVPIVCFIGCFIAVGMFIDHSYMSSAMPDWVAYTPLPYVQLSSFFVETSSVNRLMQFGAPISLEYGIGLMLAISALCTLIAVWVFKKKDITN